MESSRLVNNSLTSNMEMARLPNNGDVEPSTDDGGSNEHTKTIILGGIDGISTALAVMSGASGAGLQWEIVVILGFSTVTAGAFSIGIGEYLSSKAHKEFVQAEKRRGQWEFKHDRNGQIKEMVKLFELRGMNRQDAELVVNKMAQYEGFFVNLMVTEELGLQPPEDNDLTLVVDAFVMFIAYFGFGAMPLAVYCVGPTYFLTAATTKDLYISALIVAGITLFVLGCTKSSFSSSHWLYSASESLVFGMVSAGIAFAIGSFIDNMLSGN